MLAGVIGVRRVSRIGRSLARGAVLLLVALALAGCGAGGLAPVDDGYGPAPKGYYRIRRGDTLSEIAQRKRVAMRTLASWNRLRPPYSIYAGNLLRIEPPDGRSRPTRSNTRRTASRSSRSSASGSSRRGSAQKTSARSTAVATGADAASSGINWAWPAKGPIKQTFRSGDRTRQGVRIGVGEGAPVGAAADGTVVYSGSGLKGYGNLIIVKHNARYLSAYGFNRELLAREGDRVKRGQRVALSGRAANGDSLLHFEIRQNGVAVDPLRFLPPSR